MKTIHALIVAILLVNISFTSTQALASQDAYSRASSQNHQRVIDRLFAKNAKMQAAKKGEKSVERAAVKTKKVSR